MTAPSPYPADPRLSQPFVFLDDSQTPAPRFYHAPLDIIRADSLDEIETAFARLTEAHTKGHYLAGYISYELGLTFEPTLTARLPEKRDHPLLCFGVFDRFTDNIPAELLYTASPKSVSLKPDWSEEDYLKRFNHVQTYLRTGDCYQINLTFPMRGYFNGDPIALYAGLRHRQAARYGGYFRLGGPDLLSLSPELFFKKDGPHMSMRPMKGTVRRHADTAIDKANRDAMAQDGKSKAENLMIVDLLRNDLSRLSKAGSVNVPELFSLETYPTLHQMTSRVVSELHNGTTFRDLFQSLFPCGSVTGAPKIRAMEIIDELESLPRGAYCGAMGYVDPNGAACFNVGIRTLSLSGNITAYNVGSGVVLDSNGVDEYAECLLKADVLKHLAPHFIETFYWDRKTGYRYIGRHMARLARAIDDRNIMQNIVNALAAYKPKNSPARIRITAETSGAFTIRDAPLAKSVTPLKIALSKYPLTPQRQETNHKISTRDFYDGERKRLQQLYNIDEVVFKNEKNELCEGSFTTLFIEKDGNLLTPHKKAGLLSGVLRQSMLTDNKASEAVLTRDDLQQADKIYMGNSLRGLLPAELILIEE